MLLYSWLDINDPAMLLQLFESASANNFTNWASPDFDREFAAAGQAADDAQRWTHLQNADSLLVDAAPMIPLYHENQIYLVHPAVRGWEDNPLNVHMLNRVFLAPNR